MKRRQIVIRDETLRDGAQQAGINLTYEKRLEVAQISAELLDTPSELLNNQIDLGMPEVSTRYLGNIKETVELLEKYEGIDYFVTGRSKKESIEAMIESLSGVPKERMIIAPFVGISNLHRKKLKMTKKDILKLIKKVILYAQTHASRIHFPLEGGYYAYLEEREFVYNIFSLLTDMKVETVPLCDTLGTALPFNKSKYISYGSAVRDLRKRFPKVQIAAHCHNDLGLAVANTVEGLINGASVADGTYFGIGERAGNTSLQTILTLLNVKGSQLGLNAHSQLNKIYMLSNRLSKILNYDIADNTPVIGKNVFTHASGIHQDGVLKDKRIYRPYIAKRIGRRDPEIVISSLSGKRGIDYVLKNRYGIKLSEKQLLLATERFKSLKILDQDPEKKLFKMAKKIKGIR